MDGSIEALLTVDPGGPSRDDCLDRLGELDALLARVSARQERFLAAIHDPDDRKRWVREEVGCLMRWPHAYAEARLHQAAHVVAKLPRLLALHEAGQIGATHIRAAADATYGLDTPVIGKIENRVLGRAGSQTPGLFRASLRRAVAAEDRRGVEERHEVAKTHEKTVRLCPLPDGMAGIWSVHTAVDAEAIMARVSERADQLAGDTDGCRVDERRADALVELILGARDDGAVAGARALVQVLVPVGVADGSNDAPGELVGHGPIPASLCRQVLADASTRVERIRIDSLGRVLADPGIDDRPDRYRPSSAQTRYVQALHPTCRFPGCTRKAARCELDHIVAWDGRNTVVGNLEPLCSRHHHLKHETRWQVWRDRHGVTHWISPTGRHYRKPRDELPGSGP
jgi:hypothetical protein